MIRSLTTFSIFHFSFILNMSTHMSSLSQIIQFSKCYLKGMMTNLLRTFPKSKRKEYLIEENCDKCLLVEKVKVKFMIWMCPSYLHITKFIYPCQTLKQINMLSIYIQLYFLFLGTVHKWLHFLFFTGKFFLMRNY